MADESISDSILAVIYNNLLLSTLQWGPAGMVHILVVITNSLSTIPAGPHCICIQTPCTPISQGKWKLRSNTHTLGFPV